MPGGSLLAEIAGQGTSVGGIQIPGAPIGSISVYIGAYNPTLGILGNLGFIGLLSREASVDAVKRMAPAKAFLPSSR